MNDLLIYIYHSNLDVDVMTHHKTQHNVTPWDVMVYYLRSLCLVTVVTTATPTDRIRMVRWQDIQVDRFYLWKWKCEKFLLRKLKCDYYLLLQSGEAHQVTQFHIMNWEPDGRCSNPKTITDVIEEVIMVQMRTGNHPIVVHCRWCSIKFLHIHTHPFSIH